MARKSVSIEELTSVDTQSIIAAISQENAQLRLELLVKQSVIEKMLRAFKELGVDVSEELDQDTHDHSH
jgi:hypothetical protein